MIKKNWFWITIFTAVVFICSFFIILSKSLSKITAEIYVDGHLERTIDDLNTGSSFEISTEYGKNTICVKDGNIWVEFSDCKNQTCVHFGKISSAGQTIICAPHKLVVKLKGGGQDADVTV